MGQVNVGSRGGKQMRAMTAEESREVAIMIRTLSPIQKADFYYFVSVQGQDPYEFLNNIEVIKHGNHDQKTHGNWATGKGSSGLTHREIYNLQVGRGDPLIRKIYAAEEKFQSQTQREIPKPFPPSRTEFQDRESYDKAYKQYSKDFDAWSIETSRNIQSPVGEKNLDGTKKGVQRYVDEIIASDWFREEFGTGGLVGKPQVKLGPLSVAGKYVFGFKNGQPYTSMSFDKSSAKNEPTILHEIAHYATTISQTTGFDGHGVEFARNLIYIASHAISPAYAAGLEKAYREEGIDLG